VFENSGNVVNIAMTGNALDVIGYAVFYNYIQAGGILVNETSPNDNGNAFDVTGSGGFYNGVTYVKFADGVVAGNFYGDVFGSSVFAAPLGAFDTYMSQGGTQWGSTDGAGGFTFIGTTSFSFQAINDVGYLAGSNGGTSIVLVDGANAIYSNGNVRMQGLSNGAGAPATILTNFNLYVDSTTGIVYID
jgi:hypothetical protein